MERSCCMALSRHLSTLQSRVLIAREYRLGRPPPRTLTDS